MSASSGEPIVQVIAPECRRGAGRLEYQMTHPESQDLAPGRIHVAIGDLGIQGAAAELRQVLAAHRLVTLLPDDAARADAFASGELPNVVVATWDGTADLGTTMSLARRHAPDAAVVVVSPWYDEGLFLEAIRLGAEDCLTASQIDGPGLMRTLLLAAERHRLTSTLRAAALTDELTGLLNRRGYIHRAASFLRAVSPKEIWQVFFDVDDLKTINDSYGHWAGDRALIEIAGVLRSAFRAGDVVARVGGDEFAVLAVAPAATPVLSAWAARWHEPLAALAERHELPLAVSVGVAQPDEQGRMTPEDLLTRADATMYAAKRLRKKLARVPSGEQAVPLLRQVEQPALRPGAP